MYVVTGATGNTGRVVTEKLLAAGKKVRAIGRSAERLAPLVEKGAEAFEASLDNPSAVTEAFVGAEGVFAMIPPDLQAEDYRAFQNEIGEVLARAIAKAGVESVVNLSSLGAHLSEGVGPINGLYDQEQRLNGLEGVNVLHLRPAFFMENILMNLGLIKEQGINGTMLRADLRIPMIATRDIGRVAAGALLDRSFEGKTVLELFGERDLTMEEVTKVLGKAIGKEDLPYVQFPYEDARAALVQMGLSRNFADLYVEMSRSFNEGAVVPTQERSAKTTTPTSIEEWAKTFAAIYEAQQG